ncbi:hypothetical protein [Chitinimonas sp. BJYL2]|uniref:hypothetical protein n=1 Tax=Chitinimonas sp. BJYL2 TaxID=2976696 RepID=UPI0022B37D8E|nr:hypothetical protein [Chitinimonas sp. BJYL2]
MTTNITQAGQRAANAVQTGTAAASSRAAAGAGAATSADKPADESTVVKLGQADGDTAVYENPRARLAKELPDLSTMLEESERQVGEFMQFLRGLIDGQGLEWSKVVKGEQQLSAPAEEIEAAKAAIAEDGEWGVRKTAERILSFALYASGGDASQIERIRAAVQQGFDEATAVWGGELPQISRDTHKAIMDELDRWAAEGVPAGPQVTLAKPAAASEAAA